MIMMIIILIMMLQDITVWCSNDYLGMSAHPGVTGAAHRAVIDHGKITGSVNLYCTLHL